MDLNLLRIFATVHELGSFSRAAERLSVPRSTVSRAVAALEDALGTVLFLRTTRTVTTTAEGKALYDRLVGPLRGLDAVLAEEPARAEVPTGTLRVTTTVDIGTTLLAEAVARFTNRYPGVDVDVHLTSAVVDLAREGFDLALRVVGGRLRGANLVARKVGSLKFQLYASPSYLARHEPIRRPEDLARHDFIAFASRPLPLANGPSSLRLAMRRRVLCDDMYFVRETLRHGAGIGALPSFVGDGDLTTGALARVLPRWVAQTGSIYLVHPTRRHVPPRVVAFRDILLEMLRQRPLTPP